MPGCLVKGCANDKRRGWYLCREHWYQLPQETRTGLNKKDSFAIFRLKLLFKALRAGYAPADIFITVSTLNAEPVCVKGAVVNALDSRVISS